MKPLHPEMVKRIEVWLAPLPEESKELVWQALRNAERYGIPFNPHASDLSELFLWHLSPAGHPFWQLVDQTTDYFWQCAFELLEEDSPEEMQDIFQHESAA